MPNPERVSNIPGNRNFRARGPVPDRVVKFFYSMRDAKDWLDGLRKQKRHGEYVPFSSIPLFGDIVKQYVASRADGFKPNMVAYTKAQTGHLAPLANYRLSAITVDVLSRFRDQLKAAGKLSPKTINRIMTTGGAIIRRAQSNGYTATLNPFELVERLRIGSVELTLGQEPERDNSAVREGDYLNPSEIRQLLEAARPGFDHALILAAAHTGARIDELLALTWGDVELDARLIYIRRSLSWTAAGEMTPARPAFYEPKTRAGIRTIPITAELATTLRRWKLACPPGGLDLVFPTRAGLPAHHTGVLRTALHSALRRAELRQVGFHSLRHSWATSMITAGKPVNQVSKYLGHANPGITLAIYTHFLDTVDDTDHTEIDRVFSPIGHLKLDTSTKSA